MAVHPAATANAGTADAPGLPLALLNPWQHGFPLVDRPFAHLGEALGLDEAAVLAGFAALQRQGALSRIGGVFGANTGGAGLLAAMAVPAARLAEVAATVSAHPGVNHNYEREHAYNLWFVMTGPDADAVAQAMRGLEQTTGLPALRLRMQRAYRIDLGFDLRQGTGAAADAAPALRPAHRAPVPVAAADRPLAALVEAGLPLVPRPYQAWGDALGRPAGEVLATLARWVEQGTLRRFGVVVRHHELGIAANAMTVFDVPDALVDACGAALATEPAVTLAYRRERAAGWPYNLYCMVHGRSRDAVLAALQGVIARSGLADVPQAVLFSRQRFKQVGARRFRDVPATAATPCPEEAHHVLA